MTQEEKELLIKDLCARLPYGIKVCYRISDKDNPIIETLSGHMLDYFNENSIVEVKPYLRPMSSMTEEEFDEIKRRWVFTEDCRDENDLMDVINRGTIDTFDAYSFIDWLNKRHFDYRGLIPMRLAISAPEGMYKI